MTAINWTLTGAQAQSLIVYLQTLGISAARALSIRVMVNRITTVYTNIATHLLSVGNIDSYVKAGNQGYVPDFTLVTAFGSLTRYIMDVCAGTWSDVGDGAQTASATVLTWIQTNRPDIPEYVAELLDDIVATDINTNLLPGDITDPADDTNIGNDAGSNFNTYMRSVASLLKEISGYLRAYCGPTTESDSNSSSNGSYIEGLDIVAPIPGQ
jgi:hypothetical protein